MGFLVDAFKGRPDAVSPEIIKAITAGNAASDYQTLQQAVQMAGGLASGSQAGAAAGTAAQTGLLNDLQAQAAGGGPNPAQAALANATGTNVANTAATIASARGAGANPGLAARSGAMAGSAIQQQAVGQSAELQANQQIAAQQLLAGVGSNLVGQGQNAAGQFVNAAGVPVSALGQQNNAEIGAKGQINQVNTAGYDSSVGLFGTLSGGGMKAAFGAAHGGTVPTGMVPADAASGHSKGSDSLMYAANGGKVPGTAKHPGKDTAENDTVKAKLTPGEIVIPLSYSKYPVAAAAFAHACALMSSQRDEE
jgi:hypothetical protein